MGSSAKEWRVGSISPRCRRTTKNAAARSSTMTHLCEHRWALSEDFERNFTQDEHLRVERRVRRKDRDGPDAADQVEEITSPASVPPSHLSCSRVQLVQPHSSEAELLVGHRAFKRVHGYQTLNATRQNDGNGGRQHPPGASCSVRRDFLGLPLPRRLGARRSLNFPSSSWWFVKVAEGLRSRLP